MISMDLLALQTVVLLTIALPAKFYLIQPSVSHVILAFVLVLQILVYKHVEMVFWLEIRPAMITTIKYIIQLG